MKYCPACGTEYDEEVIQFCTKDGSPLVEKDEPRFTALPSENSDDAGEDTVVRRRDEPAAGDTQTERGERIVIPATPVTPREPVRPRPASTYYAPPPQPNTGKVVALTILGTVAAIAFGALLFWALTRGNQTNTNINVNTNPPNMNMNMNTNGFDANFNFNSNVTLPPVNLNSISNLATNTNVKTPTPTPKPSPSPTASVVPTETPERTPRPTPNSTPRTSPTPTPRTGPRPPGNLNGE